MSLFQQECALGQFTVLKLCLLRLNWKWTAMRLLSMLTLHLLPLFLSRMKAFSYQTFWTLQTSPEVLRKGHVPWTYSKVPQIYVVTVMLNQVSLMLWSTGSLMMMWAQSSVTAQYHPTGAKKSVSTWTTSWRRESSDQVTVTMLVPLSLSGRSLESSACVWTTARWTPGQERMLIPCPESRSPCMPCRGLIFLCDWLAVCLQPSCDGWTWHP